MALSDVWLDKPAVMSALKTLLTGVTSMGPGVLVLMGNFISDPKLAVSAQSQLMSQLGKVLQVLAHKEVKVSAAPFDRSIQHHSPELFLGRDRARSARLCAEQSWRVATCATHARVSRGDCAPVGPATSTRARDRTKFVLCHQSVSHHVRQSRSGRVPRGRGEQAAPPLHHEALKRGHGQSRAARKFYF